MAKAPKWMYEWDAGVEREKLAHQYAEWIKKGSVPFGEFRSMVCRARKLCEETGLTWQELHDEIMEDARIINSDEE